MVNLAVNRELRVLFQVPAGTPLDVRFGFAADVYRDGLAKVLWPLTLGRVRLSTAVRLAP
jgi:hypothetical protein